MMPPARFEHAAPRLDCVLHNLVEPQSLVAHFLRHPPKGFMPVEIAGETPAFIADFDLTTSMEQGSGHGWLASGIRKFISRFLRFRTCFVGSTVSEYALPSRNQSPAGLVDQLSRNAADCSLLVIKDIPSEPLLVGEAAMRYNHELVQACLSAGFVMVEGQALAYVPMDFESVDGLIARMSPVRRKEIRRKLRSAKQLDVQVIATGADCFSDASVLRDFYTLYCNVYEQSEVHFDLLSPEFFRAVLQDADGGGVVFAYRAEGRLIGYNLCFVHDGMLLDKYVGFSYPQAREYNLYFVSWFNNLDYALQRGLKYYVAGWTDPEIKRRLGASFTFTRHAVYVRNGWLRRLLTYFRHHFEADAQWLQKTR